jgi:hypothetical protein
MKWAWRPSRRIPRRTRFPAPLGWISRHLVFARTFVFSPAFACARVVSARALSLGVFLFLCLFLSLFATGCDSPSSERIQAWKETEKGPAKLQAAVADGDLDPRLRAEALLALVDVGMIDRAESGVSAAEAEPRAPLLREAVPLFEKALAQPSVEKARDAADVLFSLRKHADGPERTRIDAALLAAAGRELRAGRSTGGRHALDLVVTTIGPPATPMLLAQLEEPAAPLSVVVDLLAKVADPAAKERAGASLVKRAAASREIPDPLWRALGTLGGDAATEFLRKKITGPDEQEALSAARALQLGKDATIVPFALEVAGDTRAKSAVRDEMFGVLEKAGGTAAQAGLVAIIARDPNETVRYRAFEAALLAAKQDAVLPALEAFPRGAAYKRQDVLDFLVRDIQKLGTAAKAPLGKALESPSPLARMTAVLGFEAMGDAADAALVLKLSGDKATVKGFAPGATIGKEATRVANGLQRKS